MDIRKIPAALLRGGRIEMILSTKHPTNEHIKIILHKLLDNLIKNCKCIHDYTSEITEYLIDGLSIKMSGWNCADIKRCVNDVTRDLIYNKNPVAETFDKCIAKIREQYSMVVNDHHKINDTYFC